MTTNIQPIETGGQFWIVVSVEGGELPRRGPFITADEAEAAATQIAAICRAVLRQPVRIGVVPTAPQRA